MAMNWLVELFNKAEAMWQKFKPYSWIASILLRVGVVAICVWILLAHYA